MKENEFKVTKKIVFDDNQLNEFNFKVNDTFDRKQFDFVSYYFYLWRLKGYCNSKYDLKKNELSYKVLDENLNVETLGYHSFYSMCKEMFGVDASTLTRGIAILERFTDLKSPDHYDLAKDDRPQLKKDFENFTKSKLQELLPVSDEQIKTFMSEGMTAKNTVSEIRKAVKHKITPYKEKPSAFDYDRKDYTLKDFRDYSKSEISIIAYELYLKFIKQNKIKK